MEVSMKLKAADKATLKDLLLDAKANAKALDLHQKHVVATATKAFNGLPLTDAEKDLITKEIRIFKVNQQIKDDIIAAKALAEKAQEEQRAQEQEGLTTWGKVFLELQKRTEKPFFDVLKMASEGSVSKRDFSSLGIFKNESLDFDNLCIVIDSVDSSIAVFNLETKQYQKINALDLLIDQPADNSKQDVLPHTTMQDNPENHA